MGAVVGKYGAVTTRQDNRQVRIEPFNLIAGVDTGHAWHDHIGEYHIKATSIGGQFRKRAGGIVSQ